MGCVSKKGQLAIVTQWCEGSSLYKVLTQSTCLGKPSFKKNLDFMKNFHKMVTPPPPPPYCICEILIQIFTVNELIYIRIYEI